MSIALFTVTHGRIGRELVDTACQILGCASLAVRHFSFGPRDLPEHMAPEIRQALSQVAPDTGVLILSDLYGATPCNVAQSVARPAEVDVVAGMNLPMVLRVINYAHMDLDTVARLAREGGRVGVVECQASEAHVDHH